MTTRLSIAIDPKMKNAADQICNNMGISLSGAIKMFLQQTINEHALPFKPHEVNLIPTKNTLEALKELKHPETLKSYTNTKQMMKDILNDNN